MSFGIGKAITVKTQMTVLDLGYDRLEREILRAKGSFVKVGVQENTQRRGEGEKIPVDMVTVASVNEWGAPKRKIPERSFLRSSFDEQVSTLKVMSIDLYNSVLSKKRTVKTSLTLMGQFFKSKIQQKIVAIMIPPNALSTQRRKGAKTKKGGLVNNPLIDTGQLRQGIRYEVTMK